VIVKGQERIPSKVITFVNSKTTYPTGSN